MPMHLSSSFLYQDTTFDGIEIKHTRRPTKIVEKSLLLQYIWNPILLLYNDVLINMIFSYSHFLL